MFNTVNILTTLVMYLVYMRLHYPQNGIVSIGDKFCNRCDFGMSIIMSCNVVKLSTSSDIDPVDVG